MKILAETRARLAKKYPELLWSKKVIRGYCDMIRPARKSYSQHGEDVEVARLLSGYLFEKSIYLEIGSYHPTYISNTYLLYRKGFSGVVIDPNIDSISLHRKIRRRDISINVGASDNWNIYKYIRESSPSSNYIAPKGQDYGTGGSQVELVTAVPVDEIFTASGAEWVTLMSIDTEGMDDVVLLGAMKTLRMTYLLLIEVDRERVRQNIDVILHDDFVRIGRYGCNALYINNSAFFKRYMANILSE